MKSLLRPALSLFILLSVITGLLYPYLVTGIASFAFASQASGSLIKPEDKLLGSRLIGQNFSEPGHFWGRPSATSPQPNNAQASSGSNLAPTNPALVDAVKARVAAIKAADPSATGPIPADLLVASASGLDPQISPEAAHFQAQRVAKAHALSVDKINALIDAHTEGRQLGFLGEPRVNVLELNLAVDQLSK